MPINRAAAGSIIVVMSALFGLGLAVLFIIRLVVFILSRMLG